MNVCCNANQIKAQISFTQVVNVDKYIFNANNYRLAPVLKQRAYT